jgi:hypothetical protein
MCRRAFYVGERVPVDAGLNPPADELFSNRVPCIPPISGGMTTTTVNTLSMLVLRVIVDSGLNDLAEYPTTYPSLK